MKNLNLFKSRRFKHGSMATIMTIVFVAAVVLVNVIAGLILDRVPVSVDLTEDKIYQLTEDSLDFLAEEVDVPVSITVCYPEANLDAGTFGKQVVEIINSYPKKNNNITVRWVDLLEEPAIASNYAEYGVTTYSVIVESEKRVRVVSLNDCVESQTNQQTNQTSYQSVAERIMTSAISYVVEDSVMTAAVLGGHSDANVAGLNSMLTDNNYEVTDLNISTEEIGEEVDVVAIYAPTIDYTALELAKLDAFLDNDGKFGKTVIYVASYQQPSLPNLEAFLQEWGITMGAGVLVETDTSNIYDKQGFLFSGNFLAEDSYLAEIRDPSLPYVAYYARQMSAAWEADSNRTTQVLVAAPDSTIVIPMDAGEDFNISDAASGKGSALAILGSRTKYEGTTPFISNVLAFSSDGIFATTFTSDSAFNNNEYSIAVINEITGKQTSINIAAVTFDAEALNINQLQFLVISAVFMLLIPLITLIAGIVVWLRRRNK